MQKKHHGEAISKIILYGSVNDTVQFYFEKTNGKPNHTLMAPERMAEIFRHCLTHKIITKYNAERISSWIKEYENGTQSKPE